MKSVTENINLSLLEICAVLLPGAAALIIGWQIPDKQTDLVESIPIINKEWQAVLAYLGGAYFVGYLVFFVGSKLDDWVYDKFRAKFGLVNNDALMEKVTEYKKAECGFDTPNVINIYKWSFGKLLVQYPALYAVVERDQAASKFFRSMVVVMFFSLFVFGFKQDWIKVAMSFLVMILSLLVYAKQRHKAVNTAYEYIVIVSNIKTKSEKKTD